MNTNTNTTNTTSTTTTATTNKNNNANSQLGVPPRRLVLLLFRRLGPVVNAGEQRVVHDLHPCQKFSIRSSHLYVQRGTVQGNSAK